MTEAKVERAKGIDAAVKAVFCGPCSSAIEYSKRLCLPRKQRSSTRTKILAGSLFIRLVPEGL
jgi:hypothetical protein